MEVTMKESKRYFNEIKKSIPLESKRTRDFLKSLEYQIDEFQSDNPNCTYNDLILEFGFPEDIIASYFKESQSNELIRNLKIRKYIKYITLSIIAVVIALGAWKAYLIYDDAIKSSNSRITHIETTEPEVIEREEYN